MDLTNAEYFMQCALEQARHAFELNEVPIGAVVVQNGKIIGTGFNRREMWQDPTAHAEVLAIREAARILGGWRLTDTSLFVTLEPCAMCAGAILQARVARLYFGAYEPKFGACGSVTDSFAAEWTHQVEVSGGILEAESAQLLRQFFQLKRRR